MMILVKLSNFPSPKFTNLESLKIVQKAIFEIQNLAKVISRKIDKWQLDSCISTLCRTLTSHFSSFWSIVRKLENQSKIKGTRMSVGCNFTNFQILVQ